MRYLLVVSLAVLCLIKSNGAFRILVSFPMMSRSHNILGNGVVNRLLEAGHEVVHITSFPREKLVPNLKEVDVSSMKAILSEEDKTEEFSIKNVINTGNFGDSVTFIILTYMIHQMLLEHPAVTKLLSDPNEKFDLVIQEWFFSETVAGLGPLLNCPLIWSVSTEPHWQALRLIDEVPSPAYTVDVFADYMPPLSFWERSLELYKILKKKIILGIVYLFERSLYNSVFTEIAAKRGVTMPSYGETIYNASLMFINSHPSMGSAFKLPPNAINIGGYHINDKVQPLPTDLKKLMDDAKHGVIYFSMGSNWNSTGMSDNMKQGLLSVFGKFKETIIWKYESALKNVPANVHLIQWAPQQSILAHPNLKFFITHGGLLSTTEAVYYGVPLIGLPVGADQNINIKSVENKGFGIKVTLAEDMADELTAAIEKMLSNNSYKERAKELSYIYHDRPLKPGAELVHWVNHVVNTRGAPHLRSPALHVPLYQKLYLDLFAVLAIAITTMYLIIQKFWRMKTKKRVVNKQKSS